jgi:putative ATPase
VQDAQTNLKLYGRKTILFLDEVHRFNKSQQDSMLPSVEKGVIILIGATTENPYFEVNSALLSRSMIFELKPLDIKNWSVMQFVGMGQFQGVKARLDHQQNDGIAVIG